MKLRSSRRMIVLTIAVFLSLIQSSHQTNYSCDTSATCGCSTSSATVSRIVGGESADIQSWSWAVYMSIANRYLCGGSILSSSWIITAAHCVEGFTASQITVYAGSTIRGSNSQSRQGSLLIKHPNYDGTTFVNDIALIQLNPPLNLAEFNLKPICLKSPSATAPVTSEWPPANTTVSDLFLWFSLHRAFSCSGRRCWMGKNDRRWSDIIIPSTSNSTNSRSKQFDLYWLCD